MDKRVFCVTGIDTDIGKTIATGLIAQSLRKKGLNVITQKIVQTGGSGVSEDIAVHRRLMGVGLYGVDEDGLTCPYVFSVPCSPHLAAKIDGRVVLADTIRRSTLALLEQFDLVLLEGAGGLSVPLNEYFTLLDYLEEEKYPLILVSSSKLGSINHTLNALELARVRNLEIAAVIYNIFTAVDERIKDDSKRVIEHYMKKFGFTGPVIEMLNVSEYAGDNIDLADFSSFYSISAGCAG